MYVDVGYVMALVNEVFVMQSVFNRLCQNSIQRAVVFDKFPIFVIYINFFYDYVFLMYQVFPYFVNIQILVNIMTFII